MKTKFLIIVLFFVAMSCQEKLPPILPSSVVKNKPTDSTVITPPVVLPTDTTKKEDSLIVLGPEFVRIPDKAFEIRLVDLGIDSDKKVNGYILRADVEKIDTLMVNNPRAYCGQNCLDPPLITSLKGIEAFANLRFLGCNWNEIDSLDLSQNTKLEWLACSGFDAGIVGAPGYIRYNVKNYLSFPPNLKVLDARVTTFPSNNLQNLLDIEIIILSGGDYNKIDLSKCSKLKEFLFYPNSKTTVCVNSLDQITDKWSKSELIEYKVCK